MESKRVRHKDFPEYEVWKNMRRRCLDQKSRRFDRYGGRGIKICKEWNDFKTFLRDIGRRPSLSHTLERKNNNGHYEPDNCVWATRTAQARNRSTNRLVTLDGRKITIAEACEILNLNSAAIRARLKLGWSMQRALAEPIAAHGVITSSTVKAIRRDKQPMREIASQHKISVTTVWRIKRNFKVRVKKEARV